MEIERKWLIKKEKLPFSLEDCVSHELEQFYVSTRPTIRARSIDGKEFILTVKTEPAEASVRELARNEYELPLSQKEYDNLRKISTGRTIIKTRYLHPLENSLTAEIDIFKGELEGLAYLEIEFPSLESAGSFPAVTWAEREVTHEKEFKNGYLAVYGMPPIDK